MPELAQRDLHLRPAALRHQRISLLEDARERGLDDVCGGRVAVGVPETGQTAAGDLYHHDRGGAPLQGSVGLLSVSVGISYAVALTVSTRAGWLIVSAVIG